MSLVSALGCSLNFPAKYLLLTFIYRTLGIGDDGWYEEAAAWAKDNGLLENIEKKVSPYVACPRSDVVTFLYRAIIE